MSSSKGLPFGKPFQYTDAADIGKPHTSKPPWYKRWRKPRHPVAWLIAEPEGGIPPLFAYTLKGNEGVARVSPVEPKAITPIYDDEMIIAAKELEEGDQSV